VSARRPRTPEQWLRAQWNARASKRFEQAGVIAWIEIRLAQQRVRMRRRDAERR